MSNLIARHDITEEKLRDLLDLDGFPKPSIAITYDTSNLDGFGAYTFLFKKDAVDPNKDSRNYLYEADAYTARFPEIIYDWNEKKLNKAFEKEYGVPLKGPIYHMQDSVFWDFRNATSMFLQYVKPKEVEMTRDEAEEFLKKNASKKGIYREDVELYTRNGDRKSFAGITRPYTLENIMREMGSDTGVEQGQHGMTAWKGSLSRTIRSLDEIDRNRIVEPGVCNKQYKDVQEQFMSLVFEVGKRLHMDPFRTDAMSVIDQIRSLDERSIQRAFREVGIGQPLGKNGRGLTEAEFRHYVNDDTKKPVPRDLVEKIQQVGSLVKGLPVTYLEEKPNRAVRFEEVGAIIVPNDAPKELMDKLVKKFEVPVIQYDPNKSETRLESFATAEKAVPELNLDYVKPIEKKIEQEQVKDQDASKLSYFKVRIQKWNEMQPANYDNMSPIERQEWEMSFKADWEQNKERYYAEALAKLEQPKKDVTASIKARHNEKVGKKMGKEVQMDRG